MDRQFAETALYHKVKEIEAIGVFLHFYIHAILCADILCVENITKISLSGTVKEIETTWCFCFF